MISFVRGTAVFKDETSVTVDVNGLGLRVQVPLRDAEKTKTDTQVMFFTYFNVREDAMELYGFVEREDLKMFNMLITVSGVGPKAAISMLSSFSAGELSTAIVLSDSKKISSAQGIGAKTAQRIILELKDKVSNEQLISGITEDSVPKGSGEEKEAISALTALGYSPSEAQQAVKKAGAHGTVEEIIKAALTILMR